MKKLRLLVLTLFAVLLLASNASAAAGGHWTNWARRPWNPRDIAGASSWYRADQGITIATGVSQWSDLSGNGHAIAQGNTAKQPAFIASAQNGQAVIRFDGVDDFLVGTWTQAPTFTNFIAGKWIGAFAAVDAICDGGGTPNSDLLIRVAANNLQYNSGTGINYTPGPTTQTFHVYTTTNDQAGTLNSEIWEDGTLRISGAGGANVPGGAAIGAAANGTSPGNVDVGERIIYNRILSASEKARVNAYLRVKWGTP